VNRRRDRGADDADDRPDVALPSLVRRGRGAVSNPTGRFEPHQREAFDDGWASLDQPLAPLETVVTEERSRSIISRNDSPDIPFDRSINPYKGCEHGCVYCFARPTHAYLGLSPGQDFETRIVAKPDGPEVLRRELARKDYVADVIALGANTDPYQPVERRLGLTRRILEVLREHHHPVSIVTKSALVLRDLDLLRELAAARLASVYVSITSLDPELARRMEPRAAAPHRRLEVVRALAAAGVPVGVLASPMIPALNDHELERILDASAAAGAGTAGYILVRLPLEIKELFADWLDEHYPDRAARVLALIRGTRGGQLYDSTFGVRMRGTGPVADLLADRFRLAARRLGLDGTLPQLDRSQFRRPSRGQLSLF
jgi:DNA repair photolyase